MASTSTSAVQSYAPGEHPDWPAPSSVKGPVHWIKTNLFGSVTNTLLTLLTIYLLYKIIPAMVDWMFIDAAYTGTSRKDCEAQASGACWAMRPAISCARSIGSSPTTSVTIFIACA